jgi:glutamate synthase (NADPH/NADH) small chain
MNNPQGFLTITQKPPKTRPPAKRIRDWKELYLKSSEKTVRAQAERCMDCGVPFCHTGCPLVNLIPEWNILVYNKNWQAAYNRLSLTNNFPEFTGTLCPAPCEPACVLGINEKPVTIKQIELAIIEKAFKAGWVRPRRPFRRNGMNVAVVGSGPAGLTVAQELNRKGYRVTVYEQAPRPGGLLRYGIPEFKMEKWRFERRLVLLEQEGIRFKANVQVGVDISARTLGRKYSAVVLAIGSTAQRDLPIPGRDLDNIYFAREYLTQQNRRLERPRRKPLRPMIGARGKRVVVIGGGDTGSDCLGTAHRQGARSVIQLQHRSAPPEHRSADNPWPEWPRTFILSSSQEEGGSREFALETKAFLGKNGAVAGLSVVRVAGKKNAEGKLVEIPGTPLTIKADLVLLALGYTGPETAGVVRELGLNLTAQGTIATNRRGMTSQPGIFATGDAVRGQSLVVWAIAEGRKTAEAVHAYLRVRPRGNGAR